MGALMGGKPSVTARVGVELQLEEIAGLTQQVIVLIDEVAATRTIDYLPDLVQVQLDKAAVRLAAVLNSVLK
jgi:hypothetical protein